MGDYSRALGEAWILLLLIASALIAATVFLTFSTKRILAARPRHGRQTLVEAKRFLKWVMLVAAIAISVNYGLDARNRAGRHACEKVVSTTYDGLYTAEYCYTPNGKKILQLYRTDDKALLAERTYDYPEPWRLFWIDDYLVFMSDDGGEIKLPPTFMDRMLAKLP